jgi:hypothetical protein
MGHRLVSVGGGALEAPPENFENFNSFRPLFWGSCDASPPLKAPQAKIFIHKEGLPDYFLVGFRRKIFII